MQGHTARLKGWLEWFQFDLSVPIMKLKALNLKCTLQYMLCDRWWNPFKLLSFKVSTALRGWRGRLQWKGAVLRSLTAACEWTVPVQEYLWSSIWGTGPQQCLGNLAAQAVISFPWKPVSQRPKAWIRSSAPSPHLSCLCPQGFPIEPLLSLQPTLLWSPALHLPCRGGFRLAQLLQTSFSLDKPGNFSAVLG